MFDWSEKLFCSLVAGAAAIRASFTRLLLSILQKYLVKAKVQQLLINPLLHSLHQAQAWARMHGGPPLRHAPWIAVVWKGDDFHTQSLHLPNHYLCLTPTAAFVRSAKQYGQWCLLYPKSCAKNPWSNVSWMLLFNSKILSNPILLELFFKQRS